MSANCNGTPHVAVMAFPFASHPHNLFDFTCMLASSAPEAAFSFFSSAENLDTSLSQKQRPDNIRFYAIDDGRSKGAGGPAANATVLELIGLFIKAMPANLVSGIEAAVKDRGGLEVSCIVSDSFVAMARDVAEELEVPWVSFNTCGSASQLAHICTDEIRRSIELHHRHQDAEDLGSEEVLLEFISGLSALRIRDLPLGIISGDIHSDFSILLHQAADNLPHATAVAINTFQGLEPEIDAEFSSRFKKYLPIGPCNLTLAAPADQNRRAGRDECLSWLDRHGSATVVYVCFGTITRPPKVELEELAQGLEDSCVPFLWSMKESTAREELPAGFTDRTKDRGLFVSWAPQVQVLGHSAVGVFVTHCGWTSVMEAIASGVPMVCRPILGDHHANARMASHVWGVGVPFDEGITREGTVGFVNMVLKEEEGKKMKGRACELRERAQMAAAPGGSSTENVKCILKIVRNVENTDGGTKTTRFSDHM